MRKRFWQSATVAGLGVALDGKPLRLPSGLILAAPSPALAAAIAAEWQAAPAAFGPRHVPLTGLAGAAQERVAPNPAAMAATLAGYARSDVLCYRATHPDPLVAAEAAAWDKWLDWAAQRFGARLLVCQGVMACDQPPEALARLEAALAARSVAALAALGVAVPILGSCVLGLALAEAAASPETLFADSAVDELFQSAQWGEEAEAAQARAERRGALELAARFLELAREG